MARDFEQGLHAVAWDGLRENYGTFAGLALVLAMLDTAMPMIGLHHTAGADFTVSTLLSLLAHWALLHGLSAAGDREAATLARMPILRFLWASILLLLPALVVTLGVLFSVQAPAPGLVVALLAGLAAFAATLALVGTVLPSIVLGGKIDVEAALRRGRPLFGKTLGWLLAGPGVFWAVLVAAQVGLSYAGLPPDAYDEATDEVFWPGVPLLILVEFAVLYANLLGAAVLCRAYFRGEAAA